MQKEIAKQQIQDLMQENEKIDAKIKELKEQKEMNMESAEMSFNEVGEDYVKFETINGDTRYLIKETKIKDKLNKKELAEEIGVSKDELKTPKDFVELTDKKILTPHHISKHITSEPKSKMKVVKKIVNKD